MSRVQSLLMSMARQGAKNVAADPDARFYINAVRNADGGRYMEVGVQRAIDDFVIGCKADGIWSAIKTSCILAGARTLAGALRPLVGSAPTNNNFVGGDYDRRTGLKGDGLSKRLFTNRTENIDASDNCHLSAFVTQRHTPGSVGTYFRISSSMMLTTLSSLRSGTTGHPTGVAPSDGFLCGVSRDNSSTYQRRLNGATSTISSAVTGSGSTAPTGPSFFARDNLTAYSDCRLAFYSQGQHLNLALLDARVAALVAAIGEAIP